MAMGTDAMLWVSLIGCMLSLLVAAVAFTALSKSRRNNIDLQAANVELGRQINELTQSSSKTKQDYELRIKFFVDISHELRTPLTLILSPLDDLIANPALIYNHKQALKLVQKNAFRLLKLVDQLIDLRKVELNTIAFKASENDLVQSIRQMMEAFEALASKRNIEYRLITQERELTVWFDPGMLEKVIFNLLFNAFKFTTNNGLIHVKIEKECTGSEAVITVEDNGVGMDAKAVKHAFDLFHESGFSHARGFGLGLGLVKELIDIHKGRVALTSTQWEGTSVKIQLPLGSDHLLEEQKEDRYLLPEKLMSDSAVYTSEFDEVAFGGPETAELFTHKDKSILIVEDDDDLKHYLVSTFNDTYDVLLADDGIMGLRMAYANIPDIILCDVNIPGKNGIEVSRILKNDFKTSHIPIILLTANGSVEHQIEGIKTMADAYIIKPFNIQFLRETIKSLLKNRTSLREHFSSDTTTESKGSVVNKLDKKFINDFSAIVEGNLANEDFDVDDICKSLGFSKVQLYRKVKALLAVNVNDYIINRRLKKAKYLLTHEQMPIAEIAAKVGFSSAAYFSTVFKSKFDMTPKQFKAEKGGFVH